MIFKYPLQLKTIQDIEVAGADPKLLTVQRQHEDICLWFLVDAKMITTRYTVYIVGTGQDMPPGAAYEHYIDTVQMGNFVWHIFAHRS